MCHIEYMYLRMWVVYRLTVTPQTNKRAQERMKRFEYLGNKLISIKTNLQPKISQSKII